jgi:16S rRNA (uracil1498-N3)-methyltransferase
MARRRFFVEQVRNGRAEIAGEDARHLTRVLRVEAGQVYEISDNNRAWLAEVESARKEHVVFRVGEALPPERAEARIVLLAALIKFDHFEWLIEKATELGVNGIVPVRPVRSEHGLERAAQKRIERWRRIAVEASQQSRRTHLPVIELPVDLRSALATPTEFRALLAYTKRASALSRTRATSLRTSRRWRRPSCASSATATRFGSNGVSRPT